MFTFILSQLLNYNYMYNYNVLYINEVITNSAEFTYTIQVVL